MKNSFKKALKIFKPLAILFTMLFWIYVVYDDYIFIEKYGLRFESIGGWFVWYCMYLLAFALYYWGIASITILIYHKLVKRS